MTNNTNCQLINVLIGENEHAKYKELTRLESIAINEKNEFNYNLLYADSTPVDEVITIANTFPFMGGNRLILLKNFNKYSAKDKKALAEYSENPAEYTYLIIIDNDRPDKRAAWYKAFDKQKQYVTIKAFWPYRYKELVNAITDGFKAHNKKIDYQACEVLAQLIENNPSSLDEEIKKIIDYCRDKDKITLEDIKENIKKGVNHDIYNWAMQITANKTSLAIKLLNTFSPKALQAPQLLIFVITDRFIKILKYLTLLEEGMDTKQAQRSLGIMTFLDPQFHKHAMNYNIEKLKNIFDLLIETDFKIKTGQGNPQLLLEDFILEVAQ